MRKIKVTKHNKLLLGVLIAILHLSIFFLNWIIEIVVLAISIIGVLLFLLLNRAIKRSNWYKNIFLHTTQFITNWGYRKDLRRNFSVVNLGSNPALFAFEYDKNYGQNWATGSQGPEMDLEILRYYHSYIKEGGVVLLPIVPFSSCTPYLWHYKKTALGIKYYARFSKVLENGIQARRVIPNFSKVIHWRHYPLWYSPSILKVLIKDVPADNRLGIDKQEFIGERLIEDAKRWINRWKKEFDIKNLEANIDTKMRRCQEECANKFVEIIRFCKDRELKPVLILPPVTAELNSFLSDKTKETYIYSFVRMIQAIETVDLMDYMTYNEFATSSFYINSLFLNKTGRKKFTEQVLKDLKNMQLY